MTSKVVDITGHAILNDTALLLSSIVESSDDAIISKDMEGTIQSWNKGAERIYGYSSPEIIGQPISNLLPPDHTNEFPEIMATLRRGERIDHFETERVRKDGRRIFLSLSISPIKDPAGTIVGACTVARDITERKRAQEELMNSEERLGILFEFAPDAYYLHDLQGNFVGGNRAAESLIGYPREELIGKNFLTLNLLSPEQIGTALLGLKTSAQGMSFGPEELTLTRKDGTQVIAEMRTFPIKIQGQELVLGIARDVTERKRTEKALRESERRLSTLISNLPGIAFRSKNDHAGSMEFISDGCLDLTGYTPLDLIQNPQFGFNNVINDEDQNRRRSDIQVALREKTPYKLPYRIRTAQDQTKWVWEHGRGVYSEHGELLAVEGFITDVSDQVRTEQEREVIFEISEGINQTANLDELLRRIHHSLRKVVYADNFHIALYNKEKGHIEFPYFVDQYVARRGPAEVGRSRTAYVFRTGRPILMTEQVFQKLIQEGQVGSVETLPSVWVGVPLRTLKETIGVLVVQHYSDPKAYTQRDLEFLTSVGNQIALAIERKRSDEELLLQKTRFQSLFENAPVGIVMLDEQDRILRINRAFEKTFAFSIDEIHGKFINAVIVPPDLRAEADNISTKNLNGIAVEMETVRQRKDGGRVPVHLFGVTLTATEGQIANFGIYADLTESKQLTDRLRQAQKMEAVGRLAGGIAHDFNNLLGVIIGYSELLSQQVDPTIPMYTHITEIRKAGDRAAALTRQLLAFSRKQMLQPVVLSLNKVVEDMNKMLRRLIGEHIQLDTRLDSKLAQTKADLGQVEQIIMNLAVNARDAMPNGGTLTLETANVELGEDFVSANPGAVKGLYVMMGLSDTGVGMDTEVQSHLFEPFFTTKAEGKGTGLGLATVYGIVKQSNGYIWVQSRLGIGTTFRIYLPRELEGGVNSDSSRDSQQEKVPGGSETILVVEDASPLRKLLREILEGHGYAVLEAGDPEEALKLVEQHRGPIPLLLSDVVMPGMGGPLLAEKLRPRRPEMKVLYISGYTEDAISHHGVLRPGVSLLQKPFTQKSLLNKVREVLAAPTSDPASPDRGPTP
ncbi:MAG: PAS domain S-box protein [Acidobacteriia bacterium]|nr:PAS domain S-box protein [Terriglobia bacterium]